MKVNENFTDIHTVKKIGQQHQNRNRLLKITNKNRKIASLMEMAGIPLKDYSLPNMVPQE